MKTLVSIVIPAYNSQKWIKDTISSALEQTWPEKEIIVVDDGSTDRTLSIAKKFESKTVKVVHSENKGVAVARNYGLRLAQGDYIQWLDSDDLIAPDKIEKQVTAIEGNDNIMAMGRFGAFYYRTEKANFRRTKLWTDLLPIDWMLTRFRENSWTTTESWLVSRELCEKAGPWDERLSLDEDGEYFCRLVSLSGGVKFVSEAQSFYRRGSFTSQCMNRSQMALESLLLSMELSFKHLRSMEDSERTRNACLKFLQHRARDYFPDNPYIARKAAKLAQELGGILESPILGWKLRTAKQMVDWKGALILNDFVRRIRILLARNVDRLMYEVQQHRENESLC